MKLKDLIDLLKQSGVTTITLGFADTEKVVAVNTNLHTSAAPSEGSALKHLDHIAVLTELDKMTTEGDVPPTDVASAQAPKATSEPAVAKPAVAKPAVAKPAVAKPAVAKPAVNRSVFDQFIDITTKDSGQADAAQIRSDLIGRMSRDELLRVNVEFSCGIDTDQPDDGLREALQEMF